MSKGLFFFNCSEVSPTTPWLFVSLNLSNSLIQPSAALERGHIRHTWQVAHSKSERDTIPPFLNPIFAITTHQYFHAKKIPDWISLTLQRSVLASARSLFCCCCYFRFFLCYQYAIIYPTTKCFRFWTYVQLYLTCPSVQGVNNDHLHSIIQAQFLISINVEEKGGRKILADVKFPEFLSRSKLFP